MKSIFLLCFAVIGCVSAFAQNEEPDSVVFLDELVVSANKIPELRSKLSQQVYPMTAAEIKLLNSQTMAELLTNSGIVGMQKSQQGGGSPQLRGFEASRIVLMIDGVRMNNLIYRAGHLQNVITVDNNLLDNVEILLGPSSTVYGSDALGGVVSMRTKHPQLARDGKTSFTGNGFFRYGSVNEEKTQHFDFNIGLKRIGFFTGVTFSDFGDLRMGKRTNPALGEQFGVRTFYVKRAADNSTDELIPNADPYVQKFSGYHQIDLIEKVLYQASERIAHTLNFQYSTSGNIPRYDRLTDPEGGGLRQAEWYYGPQKRLMIAYELSVKSLGAFADEMKAMLSYQQVEESRHDRRFNRLNRRNQIENVDVIGVTLDFNKSFPTHRLRYGFDGQFNSLRSTAFNENIVTGAISPVGTRYPGGDNTMNFVALYATHSYDLGMRTSLNTGVRFGYSALHAEFTDKAFFPFPFEAVFQKNKYASGNLGIVFRPNGNWKLSFMASTGYRVPNIDDLAKVFDTNAGTSLIVPNPNLKPEKTANFDFGITTFVSDKVRWENNFFYTSFFDAIVVDAFELNGNSEVEYDGQPTPVFANQNKRKARIAGLSSVLNTTLSRSFSLNVSYNLTNGTIVSEGGKPLDHIPPSFGRVDLKYSRSKFTGSAFVNFNGWKRIEDYFPNGEDNEVYATAEGMPSWYTINVRAAYQFNSYLALQLGTDNLLDLQYRTFASGINSPGRNLFATLRVNF
ncbi:MAG TPA: TonB-dependent receptor [Chryseosolibacter sp.]